MDDSLKQKKENNRAIIDQKVARKPYYTPDDSYIKRIFKGDGFYMWGVASRDIKDLRKIHEPWDPTTVDGTNLFQYCDWLTEWDYPMPNLEIGKNMFYITRMRKFRDPSGTSLTNLSNGVNMFSACSLDDESIRIIAEQIKDWRDDTATHSINLGIDEKYKDQVAGYLETITNKGWTVTTGYTNFYTI